jgi:predicted Zn-dependent protease
VFALKASPVFHALPVRCLAAAAALAGPTAFGGGKTDTRLLPDLFTHLGYAESGMQDGKFQEAIAHSEAILTSVVRVEVRTGEIAGQHASTCEEAAERAFAMWERALGHDLKFVKSAGQDADVTLTFEARRAVQGKGGAGHARWQRSVWTTPNGGAEYLLRAEVEVRAFGFRGEPQSRDVLAQVAAHELGHVLGMKESGRVGDLMGPVDSRRLLQGPTPQEIEALAAIRRQAATVRRQCALLAALNLTRV